MNLLTIFDLDKDAICSLIERAIYLKERHKRGIPYTPLKGKTLALIFEKPSTRTRLSFESAMYQLGGNTIFMSPADSQIGRGEPVRDSARVISRYVDAVCIRTFGHGIIEEFSKYSTVPVINGLTDTHHPCQVLTDIMTVVEKKGTYKGLKYAWIGDGNNMANSWIELASRLELKLWVACPKGYCPDDEVTKRALTQASGEIEVCKSVESAADGADVLNTDVWASMGQEKEKEVRKKAFQGFQINESVLKLAKADAIVMHCLPAHRGEEITDEVIEGKNSVVWEQAENRLHMQKALIERILG